MHRRLEHSVVRKSDGIQTTSKEKRERLKKTLLKTIRNDLRICNLIDEIDLKPFQVESCNPCNMPYFSWDMKTS